MKEFSLIEKLSQIFQSPHPTVLGIGDDAAIFQPPSGKNLVWTTDTLVEKIHFQPHWISFYEIGLRAATASLSDLAAMGALPLYGLVTFHLPSPSFKNQNILETARGIQNQFHKCNAFILGGNLTRDQSFSIEISSLGAVPRGKSLRRSGAKPGDDVYVSGCPGKAGVALYFLQHPKQNHPQAKKWIHQWKNPLPQIELGQQLLGWASSVIDISDGLFQDAGHVALQSKVDLSFLLSQFPPMELSAKLQKIRFGPSDDYELLFTAPFKNRREIERKFGTKIHRVGLVKPGTGKVWIQFPSGKKIVSKNSGWDHLRK